MKKSSRLNDTEALTKIATPSEMNEEVSVSVRKIDNGYIKRVSDYSPGGAYKCEETYSVERPSAMEMGDRPVPANPFRGAIATLNRK